MLWRLVPDDVLSNQLKERLVRSDDSAVSELACSSSLMTRESRLLEEGAGWSRSAILPPLGHEAVLARAAALGWCRPGDDRLEWGRSDDEEQERPLSALSQSLTLARESCSSSEGWCMMSRVVKGVVEERVLAVGDERGDESKVVGREGGGRSRDGFG